MVRQSKIKKRVAISKIFHNEGRLIFDYLIELEYSRMDKIFQLMLCAYGTFTSQDLDHRFI